MRYSRLFALAFTVVFCPACGGCGHDKVIIKDERQQPAATVTVVQPAPAPPPAAAPATTVNVNH